MQFIETETLELKKSTSELKEAVVSVCAMLNKHGQGTLWFGVADDGTVTGQQIGKSTLKDISKAVADHLDPQIIPQVAAEKIDGKTCIRVDFSGKDGLYSAYGRFYLRAGEEDRIEIYNPGRFPEEYSPEDFIKGSEPSIPRNPLVAEALFRCEDIEKWGSGLRRISRECRAAGIKVEFRRAKSGFFSTFWRPSVALGTSWATLEDAGKGSQKSSQKIVSIISADPMATIKTMSEALGISDRAVKKHLQNLSADGIIKRVGPDKGGHWEVLKP